MALGPGWRDTMMARIAATLRLPRVAVDALTAQGIQAADRLKAGELRQDEDLVFTTATGGDAGPAQTSGASSG